MQHIFRLARTITPRSVLTANLNSATIPFPPPPDDKNTVVTHYVREKRQNDGLLHSIKTSTDAFDLFDVISRSVQEMNGFHIVQSLRSLYNLQKNGSTSLQASEIIKHPEFEKLCRSLKSQSRHLELNDVIESIKFLSYLGVNTNSEIMVVLLNHVRYEINTIELNQVVFLDFLLRKFEPTPLVEALRIALPVLFQINLSAKIDHENVPQLTEFLAFASKQSINEKCTMNVVSALTLHGENLSCDAAMSVIWSLSDMKRFLPSYQRLLQNAFNALLRQKDKVQYHNLETTLGKLTDRLITKAPAVFYNEEFLNFCADYVVQKDVGFLRGIYVVKKFNKISFVNVPLLDYIAQKVEENPKHLTAAKFTTLFTFITSFSTANYCSRNWNIISEFIYQNTSLESDKIALPWMRFSLELMSLNCCNHQLVEKMFGDDFLEKHMARENNFLDYIQLMSLYQSVKLLHPQYVGEMPKKSFLGKATEIIFSRESFPLREYLEAGYPGGDCVLTKVNTRHDQLIDYVIAFRNGVAIDLGDSTGTLEDLQEQYQDVQILSILGYPRSHYTINANRLKGIFELRGRCLEALGVKVLTINISHLDNLTEADKITFLTREIEAAIK